MLKPYKWTVEDPDSDDNGRTYLFFNDTKTDLAIHFLEIGEIGVMVSETDRRCTVEECNREIKEGATCGQMWQGQYEHFVCSDCLKRMYDEEIKNLKNKQQLIMELLNWDLETIEEK